MKVEVIKDIDTFKGLQTAWNNLLSLSNAASIFLTWEWLYYWWLHFRGNRELFILLIKGNHTEKLIGIAPFCIQQIKLLNLVPLRAIKFLGTDKVDSDFLDFIAYPGMEKEVVEAVYNYLDKYNHKWDIVEIGEVDEDSPSIGLLRKNINGNYRVIEKDSQVCPYIKLPKDYESYLKSLSSNMRQSLNRKTKRLEDKYRTSITIESRNDGIRGNIDTLFKLHQERIKSKKKGNGKTAFIGDDIKKFHYDVASDFSSNDWLKFYFLDHNKETIASLYAFRYKNRLFYYQSGLNPDYQKWSAGNVLFGHAIKDSIKDGLSEFHYLRGDEDYKFKWAKEAKKTKNMILINQNSKGRICGSVISAKEKIKHFINGRKQIN